MWFFFLIFFDFGCSIFFELGCVLLDECFNFFHVVFVGLQYCMVVCFEGEFGV